MKLLCVDTSTKVFSLAVSDGERVLRYRNKRLLRILSDSIIPSIRSVLADAGIRLEELDGFGIGLGPGSFTSLRIGIATVKAFGLALQKPFFGISSLDLIARNAPREGPEQVCVLCDARRDLVYGCVYLRTSSGWERQTPYMLCPPGRIFAKLTKKEATFLGDGLALYRDTIYKQFQQKAVMAGEKLWYPQARNMVPLALKAFRVSASVDYREIKPLYLYPEDCQIQGTR